MASDRGLFTIHDGFGTTSLEHPQQRFSWFFGYAEIQAAKNIRLPNSWLLPNFGKRKSMKRIFFSGCNYYYIQHT
jgi:hypothetical protein